jgi:RNA polymerase sigma-70 factor (ECF subfamily)
MKLHSVRPTDDELEKIIDVYFNMLFKLCFTILCNKIDAEDAVSETILKYITKSPEFSSEEHRKAWLIRVATNICNNMHRFQRRNNHINIDDLQELTANRNDFDAVEEVIILPAKYKTVLHLHYIEGYKVKEIADILKISVSAAKKRLQYAREKLRIEYRKELSYEEQELY